MASSCFSKRAQARRDLSVAMIDLDFFKRINDEYGHASGDTALIGFARAFSPTFPDALLGRLGGEEFAMVSQQDAATLSDTLDQLRSHCATLKYAIGAPPLSFSAGIYHGAPDDLESLLHQADLRLYQAKNLGRGRNCWQ
jgi:diguanylate cyclase (GGDEF)-like protein